MQEEGNNKIAIDKVNLFVNILIQRFDGVVSKKKLKRDY